MDIEDLLTHSTARLHARGERMTSARRAVLTAMAAHPGLWSADDIATFVAEIDPAVHRSSVYRCLDAFMNLGIVRHTHLGHGATVYHLTDADLMRAQCRTCGRIVELPASVLEETTRALLTTHQFHLDPSHVALSGTCGACSPDGHVHPATGGAESGVHTRPRQVPHRG